MELRCEVHQLLLQRVERVTPRIGRRLEFVEYVPTDDFGSPERLIFPHARPSNGWDATYHFCPRCEEAKREWRQRAVQPAPIVRPARPALPRKAGGSKR